MNVICPTCGSSVGEDELIAHGDLKYCKHCKDDYLQRLREGAPTGDRSASMELISDLRRESTWKLVGLTIVTLGIYTAHYMVGQTKVFNRRLPESDQISGALVYSILWLSYLAVLLFIPYLFLEGEIADNYDRASSGAENIGNILMLIWGFKARNRMNKLLDSTRADSRWFHGFWTFLFTPFYFNFKVNTLAADNGQGLSARE